MAVLSWNTLAAMWFCAQNVYFKASKCIDVFTRLGIVIDAISMSLARSDSLFWLSRGEKVAYRSLQIGRNDQHLQLPV